MNIINEKWGLIPSDPAVFDDMIQQYGVKDTKVQEVLTLDFEDLVKEGPVHGLIFISKYVEEELPDNFHEADPDAEAVIFTAQVITNVCGTLALLAILFNADIDRGDILNNFLEFTKGFSPVNRGICLGNSEQIRTIHDAYATHANQIDMDDTLSNVSENDNAEFIDVDDFHYITYIQKDGYVWELDGLKYQPVKIAQCNEENWLEVVKPVLQQRMNSSTENELTFSLMAVTRDSYGAMSQQHKAYEECLQITQQVLRQDYSRPTLTRKEKLCLQIMENNNIPQQDILLFWEDITKGNKEAAQPKMEALQKSAEALKTQLQQLSEQKNLAKIDVERQKFDYFPFINALLTKAYIHQLLQDQSQPKRKKAKKTK